MPRFNARFAILSGIFLFSVVVVPLAHADENNPKISDEPQIRVQEANLPTQIIQNLYPAVPFYTAKVFLDYRGWSDTGTNKFVGYVILASAFHAAEQVPNLLSGAGLLAPGSTAQSLSSFAMFIPAWILDSTVGYSPYLFAAGANQLGQGFRHALKEHSELLDTWAIKMNFTQHNRQHVGEVAKSTGSVLALTAIGYLKHGHALASRLDSASASVSFTSAYVLREALIEHFRHSNIDNPEINSAALLSFVGMLGTALTNPGQMPAIVSEALLEAGFYTGVDHLLGKVADSEKRMFTFFTAALGAMLYTPQAIAVSPRLRIQNTLASAMILPAAFTTLEIAKAYFSHLYYRP